MSWNRTNLELIPVLYSQVFSISISGALFRVCLPWFWRILSLYLKKFPFLQPVSTALTFPRAPPQKTRLHLSVTIHHVSESSKICPSPSLVQAEQTHPTHLSWCTMGSSPLPLNSLCFVGVLYARETQMGHITPARHSPTLTNHSVKLLANPVSKSILHWDLDPFYHQTCRASRVPLLEQWGDFSLLLREPSCSATLHPFLCKWCCPQGPKPGSWYDDNRCHSTAALWWCSSSLPKWVVAVEQTFVKQNLTAKGSMWRTASHHLNSRI